MNPLHVTLDITEAQARTIMAAVAFLSDDDPLKRTIVTAIAFARRLQSVEQGDGAVTPRDLRPTDY
jgi:hypothetical protein